MGDHTDYEEGYVLPMAIDLECVVAAWPGEGAESLDPADDGWRRYVDAVAEALGGRGVAVPAVHLAYASSLPLGAGLSSSAAFEVATALALGGEALDGRELALACQEAEHRATGVPSGIMDQLTSVAGRAGHALRIDCRDLDIRPVRLPGDLAVVVVHSGVPRTLEGSKYADRRNAAAALAARLGLRSLRDARPEQVAEDPVGRHIVSESERVLDTARALEAGDRPALAALFAASHVSLRDDLRISTPELDALVDAFLAAGAVGARLTGGGFGGCAVALCDAGGAEAILEQVRGERWGAVVRAADGASSF